MRIFIDVETRPTTNPEVIEAIRSSIKHPGNISKPETIEKWYTENSESAFQEAYRRTALDALYGEIISISWAINDEPVNGIIRLPDQPESDLLNLVLNQLANIKDGRGNRSAITQWVGHCVSTFDMRFIWQRCVINRINPPIKLPINAKPWDDVYFDTRTAWTGGSASYSGKSSLSAMAPVFGLHKSDIDGSMVYDMYLEGKYDEILQYNKDDVEDCRILYKRMNFINDALPIAQAA